jgi:membrane-associated phospholipid phosphatase
MTQPPPEDEARVRRVLKTEIERIDSPDAAEAVAERMERLAAGETEQTQGDAAAQAPVPAAAAVEQAAAAAPAPEEPAAVLVTAAAQAVAPTPEAPEVLEAAQEVLGSRPAPAPLPPETERGRELLQEAVLHRMSPLQALDARLFLAVNRLPHPVLLDRLATTVTVMMTSGGAWILSVLVARYLGVPRGRRALVELVPTVLATTWIVEYPMKAVFRRRRPFIDIVRAMVVGKRPGSWSFPSGHTASAFASAYVSSRIWPRRSPLFFAIASVVGFSRIYVGAHYPGDVSSGAVAGVVLAAVINGALRRLMR